MAKNTIIVKSYNEPIIDEKAALAAITPGMLIERTSADKVRKHATSEGDAIPMFATEDDLQGNGITDDYAANDIVQCWFPQRGERVYAILANGETAVIGSYLASNGDGKLKVHVADDSGSIQVSGVVARAVEAVDMSGSSGADSNGRIIVEIV